MASATSNVATVRMPAPAVPDWAAMPCTVGSEPGRNVVGTLRLAHSSLAIEEVEQPRALAQTERLQKVGVG